MNIHSDERSKYLPENWFISHVLNSLIQAIHKSNTISSNIKLLMWKQIFLIENIWK